MMESWEVAFGQLRSILSEINTLTGRSEFWKWLVHAHTNYPEQYKSQAIEYITHHTSNIKLSRVINGWDALESASALMPFATFDLRLNASSLQPNSELLNGVERLWIQHSTVEYSLFEELVQSSHLSNLEHLSLIDVGLTPAHLHLFEVVSWEHLSSLTVSNNKLRDCDFAHLKQLSGLKELNLGDNELHCDDVLSLMQATSEFQLHSIDLRNNQLKFEGIQSLVTAKHLKDTTVNIEGNQFDGKTIALLLGTHWSNKSALDLTNHNLTDEDFGDILASGNLSHVYDIDLTDNQLTTKSILTLLNTTFMTNLIILSLSGNDIGMDDVTSILMSDNFPLLGEIYLWNTKMPHSPTEQEELLNLAEQKGVQLHLDIGF